MKKQLLAFTAVAVILSAGVAIAQGNELAYFRIPELSTLSGASVDIAADYIPVYDASANQTKRALASFGTLGVNATVAEIDRVADDSARVNSVTGTTAIDCATHGTGQVNYISSSGSNATLTLPAATGSGCSYEFVWSNAPTASGDVIQVTGDDSFNGVFLMAQDSADTLVAFETAADTDKLTFTSSTKYCATGLCRIEFQDVVADKYYIVDGVGVGTGTEATPGATAQRP